MTKVSLTLDSDVVREARERVGPRELSAYVNAALRQRLQHDRLAEFLAEADEEAGRSRGRAPESTRAGCTRSSGVRRRIRR